MRPQTPTLTVFLLLTGSPTATPASGIAWTEQVIDGVVLSLMADGDRFVAFASVPS